MKKLVKGILEFRQNVRPTYRETFARLALGQSPDALFIACSDSRVTPNVFASTDPGDMFVIRNVGNLVPPCCDPSGHSAADESEAAAIEFAVKNLTITDIIICGHSECGAMQALLRGRDQISTPNLQAWLRHGEKALQTLQRHPDFAADQALHNRLSQLNVLQQSENIRSYPIVREALAQGKLKIHAWWFELARAAVHWFNPALGRFVEIDEDNAEHMTQPESPLQKDEPVRGRRGSPRKAAFEKATKSQKGRKRHPKRRHESHSEREVIC